MAVKKSSSTKEMQVTSIRFERSLITSLKQLAGAKGYQSLVREILWDYVNQNSGAPKQDSASIQIRAVMPAQSYRAEVCAITGDPIPADEEMWLGWTTDDQLVPIGLTSIDG